jgi:hypothetical protein
MSFIRKHVYFVKKRFFSRGFTQKNWRVLLNS